MDNQKTLQDTAQAITSATNVVIFLPENATRDALASSLALFLSITQTQKEVSIYYPKQPIVGWSHLVGVNKLKQQIGSKNFIISLDYLEGSIEKVSYNIAGNKFNLVIEPRGDSTAFNEKNVTYSYGGFSSDVIISVGALSKEALGKYYLDNQTVFNEKTVIVIDNKLDNLRFGKINLVQGAAAIAEVITTLLKSAQMPIDSDIASNLYDGMIFGSRNFISPAVSATTFETAAYLLNMGARKAGSIMPKMQEEVPIREFSQAQTPDSGAPPPDWLKPKIYKGSTLL